MRKILYIRFVFFLMGSNQAMGQATSQVLSAYNIYSPNLIKHRGDLKMYFGGWLNPGETQDTIYRADCTADGLSCNNSIPVINPISAGLKQVNDPSVVLHPSGLYYIMYMTGVAIGKDGFEVGNNKIYFSTSWAFDGITWSKPQLLINDAWLPSATVVNNRIILYANSNVTGVMQKYDLGLSGVGVTAPENLVTSNTVNYINMEITYKKETNTYRLLGENVLPNGRSVIDELSSTDGLNWTLKQPTAVAADVGQFRVNAPASHPDDEEMIFYGQTATTNSTAFSIFCRRTNVDRIHKEIQAGQRLSFYNNMYQLRMQKDGNLVFYVFPQNRKPSAVWASGTYGKNCSEGCSAVFLKDGRILVLQENRVLWSSDDVTSIRSRAMLYIIRMFFTPQLPNPNPF